MRPAPIVDRTHGWVSSPFELVSERAVPVWLVIVILVWIEATVDSFAWTFLGPSAVKWTATRSASEALIQGVPQNAVEIALTLGIVAWLGWWRDAGLRMPTRSPWVTLILLVPTAALVEVGAWRAADAGIGPALMAAALIYYVVQPAGEEVLFRGFLLQGLTRRVGDFGGVVLSSLLFALAHFVPWGWPPTFRAFSLLFGFGVIACAMRIVTGSLWYPIFFHGLYNLMWTTSDWAGSAGTHYTVVWYWSRSIRVVGALAALIWLTGIVLLAWARIMDRWISRLDRSIRPPAIRRP
jgi:membrane protease YdiL (CAAX protease family)